MGLAKRRREKKKLMEASVYRHERLKSARPSHYLPASLQGDDASQSLFQEGLESLGQKEAVGILFVDITSSTH